MANYKKQVFVQNNSTYTDKHNINDYLKEKASMQNIKQILQQK